MTEEEFERMQRRFGVDISAWPAPYRQEAWLFLAGAGKVSDFGEDAYLDRLILEAARMETDEQALTRKVRERIGRERRTFFRFFPMMPSWQLPAATASFAAILVAAGIAGYSVAGPGYPMMDDFLLALATGDPAVSGIETGLNRSLFRSLGEGFL
jgi:hypothetical protein